MGRRAVGLATGLQCGAASENIFNLAVIILSKDCLIGDIIYYIYQTEKYNLQTTAGDIGIITRAFIFRILLGEQSPTRLVTNDEVVITTSAHISSLTWSYTGPLSPPSVACYLYDHCYHCLL